MKKKSVLVFSVLWSLALSACSAGSMDDPGMQTETGESDGAALAGVLPPQKCERLQIKLTSQGANSGTLVNVPGPFKASLSSDGKKMSCTGPTADFVPSKFMEDFIGGIVQFTVNSSATAIAFRDPLPPQRTTIHWTGTPLGPNTRDWPANTKILSCHPYTATISAPGFADQSIQVVAELNGFPTQVGRTFSVGCRYRVKGPITITRDRPADVTGTSGDGFVYAPPPLFCDGNNCQTPACPPANQCRVASDCGAPSRFTCTNNCCLTIIH